MFGWLKSKPKKKDWKTSPAHLLLLSNFIHGETPDRFYNDENWASALKETPSNAIQRMSKEGMLKSGGLVECLTAQFKAVDLKKLLKDSSLKVSGRKQELAERLARNNPGAAKMAAGNVVVLRCTEEGEVLARRFIAEQKQAKHEAQAASLKFLKAEKLEEAASTLLAFTATEPFNRGTNGGAEHEVSELKAMFRHVPTILNEMPSQALQDLKVAAGMDALWGTNGASAWLPDDFETGISLDPDAAARMLIFYSKHLKDLQYFNSLKAKAIEIVPVLDVNCCDACRSFANKTYSIKTVPELPNPNCSCDLGCRCMYIYAG